MAVHSLDPLGIVSLIYQLIQTIISWVFSPLPPTLQANQKPLGHVAIIGAGITGISSASHLLGHGFEVTIFEQSENVGGIWSKVNSTSGLQISSIMYRFHPSVRYTKGYPKRDEILDNVKGIWKRYSLDKRTRFKTTVKSVTRHKTSTDPAEGGHGRWIVNGNQDEIFDGLIVATGTCGKPKMLDLPNQEKFHGEIVHSSHLDGIELKDKKVLIVGGGASGIEALELAVAKGAHKPTILARSDKWVIPRFTVVDALLSLQPFGRQTYFSWIPELLLRKLHYRDLEEKMAPAHKGPNRVPFYGGTPIVNSSALSDIRQGKADYIRGDVKSLGTNTVKFNKRKRGTKPDDPGQETNLAADIIVVATGFEVPSLDFLPKDLFPEDYVRPNLYLQNFSIQDTSVCCTNASFIGAVGTVGHIHIGMYARILAVFLMDASTRPHPRDARLWVDGIRWIKARAPGGAFSFFTYMELMIWLISFTFLRITRLKYFFFILAGLGFWSRESFDSSGRLVTDKQGRLSGEPKFRWSLTKIVPHFYAKTKHAGGGTQFGGPGAVKVNGS